MQVLTSKAPAAVVRERAPEGLAVESVGGVDAERRVAAGEAVDLVVLASGAVERLRSAGHVVGEPAVVLVTEAVAAVRTGEPAPDLTDAATLRAACTDATRIGVSTGPSGDAVRAVLDDWGLGDRAVVATPGVPVGRLLADGQVDLAFQQRTELEGLPGVTVVGALPEPLALTTRFVGAVTAAATDPDAAREALAVLAAPTPGGQTA